MTDTPAENGAAMDLRKQIETILSPAIDVRAPYAKVMVTMVVEAAQEAAKPHIAEIERLKVWVDDLQSGMYVNCVYCGHRYGPGETTPVSMADALKAHVEQCPHHPMSKLKAVANAANDLVENIAERGLHDNWKGTANALRAAGMRT